MNTGSVRETWYGGTERGPTNVDHVPNVVRGTPYKGGRTTRPRGLGTSERTTLVERFRLTIETWQGIHNLKALLKVLGRRHGCRCVDIPGACGSAFLASHTDGEGAWMMEYPPVRTAEECIRYLRPDPAGPDKFGREPIQRLPAAKHSVRMLGMRAISVEESNKATDMEQSQ